MFQKELEMTILFLEKEKNIYILFDNQLIALTVLKSQESKYKTRFPYNHLFQTVCLAVVLTSPSYMRKLLIYKYIYILFDNQLIALTVLKSQESKYKTRFPYNHLFQTVCLAVVLTSPSYMRKLLIYK